MVRTALHKRISQIPSICPNCLKEEETLEHLFLLCPLARAIWFGSELSLRVDYIITQKVKDWIGEWLSKPELQKEKAFWFYGQLVCNLWCIWIHRNEVIFNNQSPDPKKVISNQNFLLHWISRANQENTQKQNLWSLKCKNPSKEQSTNIGPKNFYEEFSDDDNEGIGLMIIETSKVNDWYDTCAFFRNPEGPCIIINRSIQVNSQRHADLIILREAFVHLKEFGVRKIICSDPKNRWKKLFDSNTNVNWKIFPAFADIISLSSSMQVAFSQDWHPLAREVRKIAYKATTTKTSSSWP